MSWWAVYSEPGKEFVARDGLNGLPGHTAFFPYDRLVQRRTFTAPRTYAQRMYGTTPRTTKREPVVVLQPLWPRYLFLDVEGRDPDFPGVMAVRGVCDVVRGADRQPLPLPDSAGVALRAIYGGLRNERDTSRLSAFFQGRVGDRFNFRLDSPFSGFVGTIVSLTRLDEAEEIQAWIDAFGRRTPVTLKFGDVGSVISPADEGVLAAA